ncbi:MAG: hypothetical protein J3K34DRAFT_500065 [Monoraphidium minutum]|nr:MAG: hypothetical protein J3K34DRAFT_500065 [Monoraphidium minutum]
MKRAATTPATGGRTILAEAVRQLAGAAQQDVPEDMEIDQHATASDPWFMGHQPIGDGPTPVLAGGFGWHDAQRCRCNDCRVRLRDLHDHRMAVQLQHDEELAAVRARAATATAPAQPAPAPVAPQAVAPPVPAAVTEAGDGPAGAAAPDQAMADAGPWAGYTASELRSIARDMGYYYMPPRSTAGDGADPISDGAAAPPATGDSLSSSGSAGSVKPTWRDTATAAAAAAPRRYLLVSHNVNGLGFQNKRRVLIARLNALETLLHALLDCPAVRPALRWLADLWPRFSGGGAPPLTAAVWLQDSPAAWRPQAAQAGAEARAHAEQRWAYLRLAVLEAAWRLRCRRRRGGQQFEAADVVDDVIEGIERRVLADWQRTSPAMLGAAGTCPSWFPRRRRPMDRAQFEALWCAGGARAAAAACDLGPSAGAYWVYVRRRAAGGGLAAAGGGLAAAAGGGSAAAAAATSAAATAAAALPANAGGGRV